MTTIKKRWIFFISIFLIFLFGSFLNGSIENSIGNITNNISGFRSELNEFNVSSLVKTNTTDKKILDLAGHTSDVWSVKFNFDDQILASSSSDNYIKLWNVSTGQLIQNLTGHTDSVYSIAFNPKEAVLASGSADNSILLWNVESGQIISNLTGHTASIWSIAFNSEGNILASGSIDNTLKIWNVSTGQMIFDISAHNSPIRSVAFSHDGCILGSSSYDHTIKIWNVSTGQLIHNLTGHTDRVVCIAFSSNGQLLASGSYDQTIRLWDPLSGRLVNTFIVGGSNNYVRTVVFNPDGLSLASGSIDSNILIWDSRNGNILGNLSDHSASILSLSYDSTGHLLASSSSSPDRTVKLWNVSDIDTDGIPDSWELFFNLDPTEYADRNADPDHDNLTNILEFQFGTNPQLEDTEGDLIPDGYEYYHNLNGTFNDASDDLDHDGLTNLDEYLIGTNPRDKDSDNDGWADGIETKWGTDPLNFIINPLTVVIFTPLFFIIFGIVLFSVIRYSPQMKTKVSNVRSTMRRKFICKIKTRKWVSDLEIGKAIPIDMLISINEINRLEIPKFVKNELNNIKMTTKKLVMRSQMLLLKPVPPKGATCQICMGEITEIHYYQCNQCKRYVCISDYSDLQNLGRTNCPNCSGEMILFHFSCSACNLDFISNEELSNQYRCPLCGYSLPNQSLLAKSIMKNTKSSEMIQKLSKGLQSEDYGGNDPKKANM